MPEFNAEVQHGLGREQAVDRLKEFVQQVRDQFGDQVEGADGTWADNVLDFSLKAAGMNITGKLTVEDTRAHVAGTLPMIAIPFRGMIEQRIVQQLETALT
jgi:hypothetical protein